MGDAEAVGFAGGDRSESIAADIRGPFARVVARGQRRNRDVDELGVGQVGEEVAEL